MDVHLVVTRPFATHNIGDLITDPGTITQLLETHPDRVVGIVPIQES